MTRLYTLILSLILLEGCSISSDKPYEVLDDYSIEGVWACTANDTSYHEVIYTHNLEWRWYPRLADIYHNYEIKGDSMIYYGENGRVSNIGKIDAKSENEFTIFLDNEKFRYRRLAEESTLDTAAVIWHKSDEAFWDFLERQDKRQKEFKRLRVK